MSAAQVNKATKRVNIKTEEEECSIIQNQNQNYSRPFNIQLEALYKPTWVQEQKRVRKWIIKVTMRLKARNGPLY